MMSTTWEQVEERLKRDDALKEDHHVSRYNVKIEDGRVVVRGSPFQFTDHALDQLCGRAKVPAKWAHSVKNRNTQLFDDAMNDGLEHVSGNGQHLFRCRAFNAERTPTAMGSVGSVRASLSGAYTIFNNSDFANVLHEIFDGSLAGRHQVREFQVHDRGMWMKVLFDDLRRWDPSHSDTELKLGVCIGNSETGDRNLTLRPFVYRYACTNDAVWQSGNSLEQRHVHLDRTELRRRVQWSLSKVIEEGDVFLDRFVASYEQRVADPMKAIESLLKKGKYGVSDIGRVKAAFLTEPGNHKFAVVQAMTAAAQDMDLEKRVQLETYAGKVLMAA